MKIRKINPPLSLEELDQARLWLRRIYFVDIFMILGGGAILGIVAQIINPKLFPPYGLYVGGMTPSEWVLTVAVVGGIIKLQIDVHRLRRFMHEPWWGGGIMALPAVLMQKIRQAGYRTTGFWGPLKPLANKKSARS